MASSDGLFDMAQALRKSHCDRKGEEHQCVGVVTIKSGQVCLDCPLCGKGEDIAGWNSGHAENLKRIFAAAGIDWDCLDMESRRRAVVRYGELGRQWE